MANRAYLFFSDSENPIHMPVDEPHFYESRWNIPIAWWFFFSPTSLIRMRVEYKGSQWEEPCLVETWANAKSNFYSRTPLLKKIIENKLPETKLPKFMDTLESYAKSHIMMDPNEVMEEDETDFQRSAKILEALADEGMAFEEKYPIIDKYTGLAGLKDSGKTELYIFGSTY